MLLACFSIQYYKTRHM